MAYYVYLLASKRHATLYLGVTKSRRDWKIRLIEEQNPGWVDLYPGISH